MVTRSYRGLERFTRGYKGLKLIPGGYQGLQGITKDYRNLVSNYNVVIYSFLAYFASKSKLKK